MTDARFSFTLEQLNNLTLEDLKMLATYYGVDYPADVTRKKIIIDRIYSPFIPDTSVVHKYSARLQRIMDSQKKEEIP